MKVLDLFSGIGGFSIGLERAGFETVAFCEFDKKARLVLNKHWPDVPVYDDVRTLTYEQLQTDGLNVDVICGGFPCQDISLAGKGAGLEGERSGLWFEFHRLIEEIKPKYAIIENVSALRSRGLDEVLRSLAAIGYDAEWHCIPASAVGAPHRRDRVWIVAYSNCNDRRNWSSERQFEQKPSKTLAHTASARLPQRGQSEQFESNTETRTRVGSKPQRCRSDVSNTMCEGLEGQWSLTSRINQELQNFSNTRWWAVEPDVGRVAHGVSGRVDRLKQLGNAVVPQIPELIGRAIMDFENEQT